MRYRENYIIEFLNFAIEQEYKVDLSLVNKINWEDLYNEAKEHNILSLIYFAIKKLKLNDNIDKTLLNRWKEEVFFSALREKKQEANIKEMLKTFNQENINVVALKGTIIKELYPKSEFRTMGDCDILIKKEFIKKSEEILNSLGYKMGEHAEEHPVHKAYYKGKYSIELHWSLINEQYFNGSKNFEKNIWVNLTKYKFREEETYRLNNEYMIVHLISHMAVHSISGGFGIRQLLDLYLFFKKYEENIDWNRTSKILGEARLDEFAMSLYYSIEILFGYKLNENIIEEFNGNKQINLANGYVEELIEAILANGVFGRMDKSLILASSFAQFKEGEEKTILINLIFPSINKMEIGYKYIKKNRILIPIAYIHRIFNGIFNEKFSMKDKYNFVFKTGRKADEKDNMLKNIGLK